MLNNFVNFYHNLDKKFKVIFWVAFADTLIIIAIAVLYFTYRLNNEPNHITITNWDEYASEVPSQFRSTTEQEIAHILTNYNKVSEDTFADATIRSSSYYARSDSDEKTIRVNFLVDIDSLQQTYDIRFAYNTIHKYSDSDDINITVSCPIYNDVIYSNTKCTTSNDTYSGINMYLPYSSTLPTSQRKITIKKRQYDSFQKHAGESYLAISINSCNDPTIIQEGEDFFQEWMQTRHLDSNDFYIEILNLCE